MDDSELGIRALELAAQRADRADEVPEWLSAVGAAEVRRAVVMREEVFDDARTVFIEGVHPDGERHAAGVFIDNNLGGMAKDVLLADSIDLIEEVMSEPPTEDEPLSWNRSSRGEPRAWSMKRSRLRT